MTCPAITPRVWLVPAWVCASCIAGVAFARATECRFGLEFTS